MKLFCKLLDHKWEYKTEDTSIDFYLDGKIIPFNLSVIGKGFASSTKEVRLCSRCNKKEKKIMISPGYSPKNWKQEERWISDEYSKEEIRDMKINTLI